MKPALLLIDLQHDFLDASCLDAPCFQPSAGQIVAGAGRVLEWARALSVPVVHVWTTINAPNAFDDVRMPHWKSAGKWACVEGTPGHASPLAPLANEHIVHKQFFNAFENGQLDAHLQKWQIDTLILAGVHEHACVRTAALEAYARRLRVLVVREGVGSNDALHAAITRRYLLARSVEYVTLEEIAALFDNRTLNSGQHTFSCLLPAALIGGIKIGGEKTEEASSEELSETSLRTYSHVSPRDGAALWRVPICDERIVSLACDNAREAQRVWRNVATSTRIAVLQRFAAQLKAERENLARQMAHEIGKPITQGRAELDRAVALVDAVVSRSNEPLHEPLHESLHQRCTPDSLVRSRPLGVVGMISPWNNPVAIPVGKIAPALFYGNALVWKPSPPASSLAWRVMEMLQKALMENGAPPGIVNIVCGDDGTARLVMNDRNIQAVTITGSSAAGFAAQEICATRRIPLQAELGGNNAAIVWHDCGLTRAAQLIAQGAFGFAGQRCTANRRVIVESAVYDEFLQHLQNATRALAWGDPCDETTQIGPMISNEACRNSSTRIKRALDVAQHIITPHEHLDWKQAEAGAYFPPIIVCCDDRNSEIVQEESFAPILVMQRAENFDDAIQLCNGVNQGLVAALFSDSSARQEQFLDEVQAGILKVNCATTDANAHAPFGGWKSSGVGPAEHGASNREWWTRVQTFYDKPFTENGVKPLALAMGI